MANSRIGDYVNFMFTDKAGNVVVRPAVVTECLDDQVANLAVFGNEKKGLVELVYAAKSPRSEFGEPGTWHWRGEVLQEKPAPEPVAEPSPEPAPEPPAPTPEPTPEPVAVEPTPEPTPEPITEPEPQPNP